MGYKFCSPRRPIIESICLMVPQGYTIMTMKIIPKETTEPVVRVQSLGPGGSGLELKVQGSGLGCKWFRVWVLGCS